MPEVPDRFSYSTMLRLRDSDAAGILYFPNIFNVVFEAFEVYLDTCGLNVGALLEKDAYLIPVVHAEADYGKPIRPGTKLNITLVVNRLGETSFEVRYSVQDEAARELARVRVVHVVIDRASGKKQPIPSDWVHALDMQPNNRAG